MQTEIKAGAKIDFLDHHQFREGLHDHQQNFFHEIARGVKAVTRLPVMSGNPVNGGIFLNTTAGGNGTQVGPNAGFLWAVQRLTVAGLGDSDSVKLYRTNAIASSGELNDTDFIDLIYGNNPMFKPNKLGFVLTAGEGVVIFSNNLAGTTAITVTGDYLEVPEQLAWKLAI